MFVTSKNYMYGITDLNGNLILDNIFDDIYMPDFSTLVLVHNGTIMEVKRQTGQDINIPFDIQTINKNVKTVGISDLASYPLTSTGYYSVTATDYLLKIISSISPSYEETIDELMFSQGADTVSVLVKCSWIPKFPFVYTKNYFKNVVNPYSGPLNKTKQKFNKTLHSSTSVFHPAPSGLPRTSRIRMATKRISPGMKPRRNTATICHPKSNGRSCSTTASASG